MGEKARGEVQREEGKERGKGKRRKGGSVRGREKGGAERGKGRQGCRRKKGDRG